MRGALALVFAAGGIGKLVHEPTRTTFADRLDLPADTFRLIGACEVAGAVGLMAAYAGRPRLARAAALGLTLLALGGAASHARAHEPLLASVPALVLGAACAGLVARG